MFNRLAQRAIGLIRGWQPEAPEVKMGVGNTGIEDEGKCIMGKWSQ